MFINSCYGGQARTGETLKSSARPLAIKGKEIVFPPEFIFLTSFTPDQIPCSNLDLKNNFFSFYLMKSMEGDADEKGWEYNYW